MKTAHQLLKAALPPARPDPARDALAKLVRLYVANRGSPNSEFICCITPPHATAMTRAERRKNKYWSAWDAARRALGEVVVVPDTKS